MSTHLNPEPNPEKASHLAFSGMKLITIDRVDLTFVARPHRVHQSRNRQVTFYNRTSSTVRLIFWGDPFEERGPYELSDGALLTLHVRPDRDAVGIYPYVVVNAEREFTTPELVDERRPDELMPESDAPASGDGEEIEPEVKTAQMMTSAPQAVRTAFRATGSNPEMIID